MIIENIKYRYAFLENGRRISIEEVDENHRLDHVYKCISCGKELIPKAISIDSKRIRHFCHKVTGKCCGESYIHNLAKDILKERFENNHLFPVKYKKLFECNLSNNCPIGIGNCTISKLETIDNLKNLYDKITEEGSLPGRQFVADLLLEDSFGQEKPMMFEICVSHPCSQEKKDSGYRIIELQINTEEDALSLSSIPICESFDDDQSSDAVRKDVEIKFYNFQPIPIEKLNLIRHGGTIQEKKSIVDICSVELDNNTFENDEYIVSNEVESKPEIEKKKKTACESCSLNSGQNCPYRIVLDKYRIELHEDVFSACYSFMNISSNQAADVSNEKPNILVDNSVEGNVLKFLAHDIYLKIIDDSTTCFSDWKASNFRALFFYTSKDEARPGLFFDVRCGRIETVGVVLMSSGKYRCYLRKQLETSFEKASYDVQSNILYWKIKNEIEPYLQEYDDFDYEEDDDDEDYSFYLR